MDALHRLLAPDYRASTDTFTVDPSIYQTKNLDIQCHGSSTGEVHITGLGILPFANSSRRLRPAVIIMY
jgi:hypothetical protein